jgi:hypothetical protein
VPLLLSPQVGRFKEFERKEKKSANRPHKGIAKKRCWSVEALASRTQDMEAMFVSIAVQ